jgi:hypothetical protein
MRKGQVATKTVVRRELIEAFEAEGLCLGDEIVKAVKAKDHELVDTLLKVAPYLWAKYGLKTPAGEQGGAQALALLLARITAQSQPQDVLPTAEKRAEGDE